jgi:hypothetical protein
MMKKLKKENPSEIATDLYLETPSDIGLNHKRFQI